MDKEIENIIKSKRFIELNDRERKLIQKWAGSEDEFNQMKSVFLATAVFKKEQVKDLNPTIKQRLDVRFKEKYNKQRLVWYNKLWLFLWPEDANIIKKPLLQLAAVGAIVLMAAPFLLQDNTSQKRLAVNENPSEEKRLKINVEQNKKEVDDKIDESLIGEKNESKALEDLKGEDQKNHASQEVAIDTKLLDAVEGYPVMKSPPEESVFEMSDKVADLDVAKDREERFNEESIMDNEVSEQDEDVFAGAMSQAGRQNDKYDLSKDNQYGRAGFVAKKKVDPKETIDLLTTLY